MQPREADDEINLDVVSRRKKRREVDCVYVVSILDAHDHVQGFIYSRSLQPHSTRTELTQKCQLRSEILSRVALIFLARWASPPRPHQSHSRARVEPITCSKAARVIFNLSAFSNIFCKPRNSRITEKAMATTLATSQRQRLRLTNMDYPSQSGKQRIEAKYRLAEVFQSISHRLYQAISYLFYTIRCGIFLRIQCIQSRRER